MRSGLIYAAVAALAVSSMSSLSRAQENTLDEITLDAIPIVDQILVENFPEVVLTPEDEAALVDAAEDLLASEGEALSPELLDQLMEANYMVSDLDSTAVEGLLGDAALADILENIDLEDDTAVMETIQDKLEAKREQLAEDREARRKEHEERRAAKKEEIEKKREEMKEEREARKKEMEEKRAAKKEEIEEKRAARKAEYESRKEEREERSASFANRKVRASSSSRAGKAKDDVQEDSTDEATAGQE